MSISVIGSREQLLTFALALALGAALGPRGGRLLGRLLERLLGVRARPRGQAAAGAAAVAAAAVLLVRVLHGGLPFLVIGLAAEAWALATRVALGVLLLALCLQPRSGRDWGNSFVVPALAYCLGGLAWALAWTAGRAALGVLEAQPHQPGSLLAALETPGRRLAALLWAAAGRSREITGEPPAGLGARTISLALVILVCLVAITW